MTEPEADMLVDISYILLLIKLANVVLHFVGCHALVSVYKLNEKTTLQLLICNISLIEAIRNLISIMLFVPVTPSGKVVQVVSDAHAYIRVILDVIRILHFQGMIVLIVNRLLDTVLDWKYRIHCTLKRAKIALIVTWFIATGLLILFSTLHIVNSDETRKDFFVLDLVFISLVIVAYGCWLYKYNTSVMARAEFSEARIDKTLFEVFQESKFYITDLLVLAFTIIPVIPDLVLTFVETSAGIESIIYSMGVMTCIPVCDLVHAFIMYFLQKEVRDNVMSTFKCRCCRCADRRREGDNTSANTDAVEAPECNAVAMYKI